MKRIIITLLFAAMALGTSACGSSVETPDTPNPTQYEEGNYAYNQAVSGSLTYISDYSVLQETLKTAQKAYSGIRYNTAGSAAESTMDGAARETGYSGTNVQVEGVDEGDIIKTDGEYIYMVSGYELVIFRADGPNTVEVSRTPIGYSQRTDGDNDWAYQGKNPSELYIYGDRVAVVSAYYSYHNYENAEGVWQYENESYLTVDIYDVSDPAAPSLAGTLGQDGSQTASRMMDGKLYVVSTLYVYDFDEEDPATYVPGVYRDGESTLIDAQSIYIMPNIAGASYAVICVYDIETAQLLSSQTVLGAGDTVYMNEESLYLAAQTQVEQKSAPYTVSVYTVTDYSWRSATEICRFSVSEGTVTPGAVGRVEGRLDNQFSMDEYEGRLRVVTTLDGYDYKSYVDEAMGFENIVYADDDGRTCALNVFDAETMSVAGSVTGLAPGEQVYSVRFDGDWAYFCTYETIDPLFAVDIADPENPKVTSEFEISGFSEYLHVWKDGLLFGLGREIEPSTGGSEGSTAAGMKLVMFDISDKADVTAKSTLTIDEDWSEALYNHKAILIDAGKNIIGFPAGEGYDVYGWTAERGFFLRARIETGAWGWGMRGLYIGNYIYVVSDSKVTILDTDDFILSAVVDY